MEQWELEGFGNEPADVATLEDWKVDKMVEEVKQNNEELKRYEEIVNKRIEELKGKFEQKKEAIQKKNHFLLTTLNQYAKQQKDLKSTKTQYKYPSLSGDIVIKKPTTKIQKPKKDKEEDLMDLYPEFVEVKEVRNVKWGDIKKRLVVQGDKVFDKETGEEVTNAVEIVTTEETIVK